MPATANPYASFAPATSPRHWFLVVNGGALFTLGVLLFLAWIQPVSSAGERVEMPATFQFKVEPSPPPKRAEPPPREDRAPPKKAKRVEKPKSTTVARSPQSRPARAATNPSAPRGAVRGVGTGVSLGAGLGAGGGGPTIAVGDEFDAIADEVQELVDYKEAQERIRSQRFEREEQDAAGNVRSQGVAKDAVRINDPKVPYPPAAKQKGISGVVQFRALVGVDGTIEEFEILEANPPGFFEKAIEEQVIPRLKFRPAQDAEGRPLPSWEVINYRFKLTDA
jgi:TonB family protein